MGIYKFDTSTHPITRSEWDDGVWDTEQLSRNEVLTANDDGTFTLVKTYADLVKAVVYAPTTDATDDPSWYSKSSESYTLPDGTVVAAPGEEEDNDGIEDDQDGDGSNDDNLNGTDGNDLEHGGNGDDLLDGGAGNDDLSGDQGDDHLNGGAGVDKLKGGVGFDVLAGGDGNDSLNGEADDDVLEGGTGNDNLSGGTGSDDLDGGTDNDRLDGGAGKDLLRGGDGADVFRFVSLRDSGLGTLHDVIADFASGDHIDLSLIDAKAGFTRNDAFTWLGGNSPTLANANGALWFKDGVLYASTDADVAPEFEVELTGVTSLGADDVVL
jgi:Ca2+-binding RTX toxin-like protein